MMQKSQLSNLAAVSLTGALSCFLWLPLLPILIPFVSLVLALKWIKIAVLAKPENGSFVAPSKHLQNPTTPFSQSQAPYLAAWPSSASLPHPAGADSLPFSLGTVKEMKSFKRQQREYRQIARVMRGLDLRKPVLGV
jgi:hypothetical protein